jgi:hypothetical protein
VGGVLDGQAKWVGMKIGQSQYLFDARYKLNMQRMEVDKERLKGLMDERQDVKGLMAYQLEARNKLLEKMLQFMAERVDSYPALEQISNIVTQLGDSGSTSVLST